MKTYGSWILRAWGMMDEVNSLLPNSSIRAKPMNTRTRKTVWKQRRRLANAPGSIRKRMLKRM